MKDSVLMDDELSTPPAKPAARRRRWQWSLTTLLLLTATIAAWTAWFRAEQQSERLESEIAAMESLTRKLNVDDPHQYAVVKQLQTWHEDNRWEVYLPPGDTYTLRLATLEVGDRNFPPTELRQTLEPGRHMISIEQIGSKKEDPADIKVSVDGQPAIEAHEPAGWHPGAGWTESGGHERITQIPVTTPLVLMRRTFMVPHADGGWRSPTEPAAGVLVWIESPQIEKPAGK